MLDEITVSTGLLELNRYPLYSYSIKPQEKQLGGPEQVAAALETMHSLEESPPEVVSPGDLTLLKAWGKASAAAKQAGFRDLGEGDGAYFEVRLV